VQDEDIVKVHIHTLTPGDAMNLAQRHGEFVKIKIENMQEQHAALNGWWFTWSYTSGSYC
jgi:uncharacterized protein